MKLQLLDIFSKTAEEARVRTSGGGAISLVAFVLLAWLLLVQVRSYMTLTWDHKLIIDSSRGELMTVFMDVSFTGLPCELLNVDSINESGDFQMDLDDLLTKTDLGPSGEPLAADYRKEQIAERDEAIARRGADYAGPCFGAENGLRKVRGLGEDQEVRCMTCEDVHAAYAALNWRFDDGSGFEQCREEQYPAHLRANSRNGCRVRGSVQVPKVAGQLHFAPGESHFISDRHSHDLSTYDIAEMPYHFAHKVHELTFGGKDLDTEQPLPAVVLASGATNAIDPLRNFVQTNTNKQHQYRYYVKIVGTDYYYGKRGESHHTNQYSVTHHDRPLEGGRDADHPNSMHKSGGIPGIWLHYDISPMRVVETQVPELSFGMLVTNVLAIVGAVVTAAAVVDKGVYAVDQALKARKNQ